MALLYPRSAKLQSYLAEYFIVAVGLCHHLFRFGQKSTVQQFTSALNDSKLKAFRTELDEWASSIREEMDLNEAQANSGLRALTRKVFNSTSYQQRLATNLRVLDFCSTYNHQTAWKQIRKAGNASFFMHFAEYQEWRGCSEPCTLMYTGKLGSGKSVLLANIVDDLNISAERERFAVTYFFCRHDVPESLRARTIIGSLAKQLLCTVPDLTALSECCEDSRFTGDAEEVLELLVRGFPSSHKAYFVLDGLDECDDEERGLVVQAFQKIQNTLKILLCVSCRLEPNNGLDLITERLAATRVVSIPDDNPDIEAFIEADLERCLLHKRLIIGDPTLILSIRDALLRGSQGMFLWVTLQIQSLCSMKTDHAIREALSDLPKDLSETFSRILRKSGNSDQPLQVKTLQLVLAAYRPLTTDELREALSVIPGEANWDPSKLLNDVHSALICCGCLLIVDEEESTVRIVHHSVKQYILNGLKSTSNVNFSPEDAQRTLADIIVTYLGYDVFGTEVSRTKVRPVMAQSAPSRVMYSTMGPSSATLKVAMKLLESRRQPEFDMSKTLAEARGPSKPNLVNGFWFYSYAKAYWHFHVFYVSTQHPIILKLSTKLIQSRVPEVKMASRDYWVHSAWAAENGNKIVLELLLSTGKVDVNAKDEYGFIPLMWAAQNGHTEIVKLLLSTRNVDVKVKDDGGLTPLTVAVREGHKDIFKLLLSTGQIDIDAKDIDGLSPLMWAAQYGYTDLVELLLSSNKVDVGAKDNTGLTPLIRATRGGHKDIVELLLSTGKVDVEAKDHIGLTPLIQATWGGHKDIVELLLSTGMVNVDAKDNYGSTPLMWAAREGHEDVFKLLLSTGKVDVDVKDKDGWAPLAWAARAGHKDIVKMLLSTGRIDVEAKDNTGLTPLIWATLEGQKNIVELLLNTGKVNVETKNNRGSSPLILAAKCGYKDIVELLLSTGKVDVSAKDNAGSTPIMWATQNGHKDIFKILLNTSKIDVEAKDNSGLSPLIWAALEGQKNTVELLLSTGKFNVNATDKNGSTPLLLAARGGHKYIVELLLSTGKVDVDAKDNAGSTPLVWATQGGYKDIVELLQSHYTSSDHEAGLQN
jgi:ankyrin repeat protein